MPTQAGSSKQPQQALDAGTAPGGRGHRVKNTQKLTDALLAEKDKTVETGKAKRRTKQKSSKDSLDDDDDEEYMDPASSTSQDLSSSDDEGSNSGEGLVDNEELAGLQPVKTVPERGSGTKKRKRSEVEEHETGAQHTAAGSAAGVDALDPRARKIAGNASRKTNPIYYFYQKVQLQDGQDGDTHYRCYHGAPKILTITKAMNHNLKGLISHLKNVSVAHHTLFLVLKGRNGPPTDDEIAMAAGRMSISDAATANHLVNITQQNNTLVAAWEKQRAAQLEPFDQRHFETLLTKWIVACDHPFAEVEKPELRALLEYLHTRGKLVIPSRVTLAARVMELGQDTVQATKDMIQSLNCSKVSLTLDAWTSSNYLAFLAIVMSYVSNNGRLEELLIDFKEIIGAHSGENMAEIVWKTMEMYGLIGRVLAVMMDNATNNDTMMEHLERKHHAIGVPFNARHARLRCMPHTIHLSAQKLLEGIGAFQKKKKSQAGDGDYQTEVLLPVADSDTDALAECVDEDGEPIDFEDIDPNERIIYAIPKLRHIIRCVRASPQSRKTWLQTLKSALDRRNLDTEPAPLVQTTPIDGAAAATPSCTAVQKTPAATKALMLILDVITRWSSSHQMLGRAIMFQDAIDDFTGLDRNNLRAYRLTPEDWTAIEIVERWLLTFRSATTQMSSTKRPMLSSVHAIFRGLQQKLRDALAALPPDCNVRLKTAILEAFRKLSDYYWKFDTESPFYLWAAMLDPRIMCESLQLDCTDEPGTALDDLEASKAHLRRYFDEHYPARASPEPTPTPASGPADFLGRYARRAQTAVDELGEFWRTPRVPWETNPIKWWFHRRDQFPRLARMALDILSIPGSAVAVERIFSGGRDTISIRRSQLSAETIRVLMIVKQALRKEREVVIIDDD